MICNEITDTNANFSIKRIKSDGYAGPTLAWDRAQVNPHFFSRASVLSKHKISPNWGMETHVYRSI